MKERKIYPLPDDGIYGVCPKCKKSWLNPPSARTRSALIDITAAINNGSKYDFGTFYACPYCQSLIKPKNEIDEFRKITTCQPVRNDLANTQKKD